jgi:predicted  nucleic acid-binding Zn-ribbon protein
MSPTAFDDYDMKLSEWRGYVVRALEDLNKEMVDIKSNQKCIEDKIDKLDSRLTNLQIKVGGIAATVTIIVSIIMTFFHI